MLSKKLMTLLATFSKAELTRFRKYLEATLFNENETLRSLFQLIEEHLRSITDPAAVYTLEKDVVWRQLFKKEAYNDATMRRLAFELNQHAYQFLSMERCNSQPMHSQSLLLELFLELKLDKHYRGIRRQIKSQLNAQPEKDAMRYWYTFDWYQKEHVRHEKSRPKKPSFEYLEASDYQLDCYYILQKLKHYCDALGYRLFLSLEANIKLSPGFLDYIAKEGFLEEPPIRAYFQVAQLLLHPEEEVHFHNLKSFLAQADQQIGQKDLQTLYIHLQNYCIYIKINAGHSSYYHELFDILKALIEREIIFENDLLDPQHYKNIITVGLHIKAFEWVEQFIQEYTHRLPPENQENALNYNLAKVYFHQENYEQVIEQLREVEYKNQTYALGGKLMLLKTYFELGEYLALDSLIDSFRIYLQRNKMISRSVKQQYLNLLRFIKKLSNIAPYDHKSLEKLHKKVNESKALAAKKWVLEKVKNQALEFRN